MSRAPSEVLDVLEALLKAQLKAIEELRRQGRDRSTSTEDQPQHGSKAKRPSQTDLAYEVLLKAGGPLHIREIVSRMQTAFGVQVSRDSLVSAILKKVARGQQFIKTGKNTYGLRGRDERP